MENLKTPAATVGKKDPGRFPETEMALFNNLLKPELAVGIAVGAAAVALAPVVLPAVATAARPLARTAIKAGIILFEQGREALAEGGEFLDDLFAEARAELEQETLQREATIAATDTAKTTAAAAAEKTS